VHFGTSARRSSPATEIDLWFYYFQRVNGYQRLIRVLSASSVGNFFKLFSLLANGRDNPDLELAFHLTGQAEFDGVEAQLLEQTFETNLVDF